MTHEVTMPGLPGYKMIADHFEEHRIQLEKAMETIELNTGPQKALHIVSLMAKIKEIAVK
ncbi:hypothetical protein RUND412_003439 [Rhizina undulata]